MRGRDPSFTHSRSCREPCGIAGRGSLRASNGNMPVKGIGVRAVGSDFSIYFHQRTSQDMIESCFPLFKPLPASSTVVCVLSPRLLVPVMPCVWK